MSKQKFNTCMSPQQMKLFGEKNLAAGALAGIGSHGENCPLCAEVLDTLIPENIPVILSINERVNNRIAQITDTVPYPFYKNYKYLIGLLAILLIGSGLIFLNNETNPGSAKKTGPVAVVENKTDEKSKLTDEKETAQKDLVFVENKTEKQNEDINIENPEEKIETKNTTEEVSKESTEEIKTNEIINKSTTTTPDKTTIKSSSENFVSKIEVKLLQTISTPESSSGSGSKNGQLSGGKIKHGTMKLEDMPQYPGGEKILESYLTNKIWENVADRNTLLGETLVLYFDVTSRGKIENPDVYGKITPETKAIILDVVKNMPRWSPGKGKGSITCTVSVSFK